MARKATVTSTPELDLQTVAAAKNVAKRAAKSATPRVRKAQPEDVAREQVPDLPDVPAVRPAVKATDSVLSEKPVSRQSGALATAFATEGAPAPHFELPRDDGELVSLSDFAGRKLVIFFYPRANTPGCTKEAIEFTRLNSDFEAAGTAVLGVSADPIKTQESFRNKYDLITPLLSDATHAMLEAYGAWGEKMMYGKTFEGVLRTTVLINRDGLVHKIWRNVKVDGHADVVLVGAAQI